MLYVYGCVICGFAQLSMIDLDVGDPNGDQTVQHVCPAAADPTGAAIAAPLLGTIAITPV
jgi:hypothetical protein